MTYPFVSVAIPTYNSGKFIAQTLESLFSQSYPNLEVIVVDDGSTDETVEVLRPYMGRIVYHHQSNAGLGAARNAGMQLARGEYIAWADADDICDPDRLLTQVAYFAQNPAIVAVGTNFAAFDGSGRVFDPAHAVSYYSELALHGFAGIFRNSEEFDGRNVEWLAHPLSRPSKVYWGHVWNRLLLGNFMHPPTMMIRSSVREHAGWLRNDLRGNEDWEYITRVARLGPIALIDSPLLRYRCHAGQMSSERSPLAALTLIQVLEAHLRLCNNLGPGMLRELNSRLAESHVDAAYTFAESEKRKAAHHLIKAAQLNPRTRRLAFNLARALVPSTFLRIVRGLRGTQGDGIMRRGRGATPTA
jgi:glycosyltransferase involved in cell wall biosynthesis